MLKQLKMHGSPKYNVLIRFLFHWLIVMCFSHVFLGDQHPDISASVSYWIHTTGNHSFKVHQVSASWTEQHFQYKMLGAKCPQLIGSVPAASPGILCCRTVRVWLNNTESPVAFYNLQLGVICLEQDRIKDFKQKGLKILCERTKLNKVETKYQYHDPLHLCIPLCFSIGMAV